MYSELSPIHGREGYPAEALERLSTQELDVLSGVSMYFMQVGDAYLENERERYFTTVRRFYKGKRIKRLR